MKSATNKRVVSLLLALVVLCGALTAPALAATDQAKAAAAELYQLGLMKGSGTLPDGSPDFKLDGTATRGEAVTMLVRLLGKEQEATSKHYSHPFTDAGWAWDYIGYAYRNKLANGTGGTLFGTDDLVDAAQFVTLVLRALEYDQVDWKNPWPTAKSAGLSCSETDDFRRGDMVLICHSALSCRIRGTQTTLRQRLESQGAIKGAGYTPGPVAPTAASSYTISSGEEALACLVAAISARLEEITISGPVSEIQSCNNAVQKAVQFCTDATGCQTKTVYNSHSMTMTIQPTYTDAVEIMAYLEGKRGSISQTNAQTLERAKQVHGAVTKPGMSEYERVKAFHDWLVKNNTYGGSSNRRYTAAGALVDGVAVCDGYAMAFDLLCYLSGIDCIRVTGNAGGPHAWNKVCVNGKWYNVDATWDDNGSYYASYAYFLISDSAIAQDHVPDYNPYWPAAPENWMGW